MATVVRHRSNRHGSDSYLMLIHRFALRPIRNDKEHEAAAQIIGELLGTKLDAGESDYLDTLILLVNKYEDEHHTPSSKLSPQEALTAIMEANGLTQKDIGKLIGSESAVSMFLRGKRDLSKSHIKALVERFRIDAMLFM